MQTDRFIAHVYDQCPQLAPDIAHRCTLITIDTLCEHLSAGQAKQMASQLPDEIGSAVEAGGARADTTDVPISLDGFYDKLMFRTELGDEDTRALAKAVARTLNEALSGGEAEKVALELPGELENLLAT